ncbi:MAG: AMP-binding protein [Rhodocyclaceae bacterium]|nr:AMP-binding protein [Rhodocyclaceae bacterium]
MDSSIRLLELVTRLRDETHPGALRPVTLDAGLERDLGFDSLARAELLMRVEREFACRLPEDLLGTAETPHDLLQALLAARNLPAAPAAAMPAPDTGAGAAAPPEADTLVAVLEWHATHQPDRIHIIHLGAAGDEAVSYGELWRRAHAAAAGLQARGFNPGEAAAIMLPTCTEFFAVFFGILLAGGIPVPIYPPARPSQIEDHLRRHAAILANAGATVLVTFDAAALPARLLRGQVDCLREIVIAADLVAATGSAVRVAATPGQIAFLQYTSGSTGNPKGVMLTHANLLANVRAMGAVAAVTPRDNFVSWLPLYHDMGLICAWLTSLHYAMRFTVMSPLAFLAQPERWLWAIHRSRGTLSGAPNFAYELCLKRIGDEQIEGLDLSSWRIAFNGAEPVNADTMRRFAERFARYGLRPEALAPAYGLAECSVGLAVTLDRGLRVDCVQREAFSTRGEALAARAEDADALRFVACGRPLPEHEIRIVDAAGHELPERREGRLQFRGPSATAGYYRNPAATQQLIVGDWLDSGDYAYLAGGEVYPTGRAKDIIIKGGRNLYPQELEEAVGNIPGIRKGNVAVFGSPDPVSGTERLIVAAETKETDALAQERLCEAIRAATVAVLGVPADDVVVSSRHIVLKTSSGKIRRAGSRELYEQGGVAAPRAVWLQVVRLTLAGLLPGARRLWRAAGELAFGLRAWAAFGLLVAPLWLAVVVTPRPAIGWGVARFGARLVLAAAGIRVGVAGREHLRGDAPLVLVANHASYLDGLVLAAALPYRHWRFVAKRELADSFIARTFLKSVGCEFVERFDFRQGVADAARIAATIATGHSPVFFAEGTFTRVPGLAAFRMGAFVVAAQAGIPVLPAALRGTRDLLRDGTWLPRRVAVALTIGAPLVPVGGDWTAAVRLRDAARREILAYCGESDLGR